MEDVVRFTLESAFVKFNLLIFGIGCDRNTEAGQEVSMFTLFRRIME